MGVPSHALEGGPPSLQGHVGALGEEKLSQIASLRVGLPYAERRIDISVTYGLTNVVTTVSHPSAISVSPCMECVSISKLMDTKYKSGMTFSQLGL